MTELRKAVDKIDLDFDLFFLQNSAMHRIAISQNLFKFCTTFKTLNRYLEGFDDIDDSETFED